MKLLTYVTLSLAITFVFAAIPESEKQALRDFYDSTNGDFWESHKGWFNNDDVCSWDGLECTLGGSHVYSIYLPDNGLKGSLPKSFSDLEYLEKLDLSKNRIKGDLGLISDMPLSDLNISFTDFDTIPDSWSTLKDTITYLSIRKMALTPGPVPTALSNFKKLKFLDIGQNPFTGYIPAWIGAIPLTRLEMDQTQFGGLIPDSFYNLRNTLEHLDMSDIPVTPAPIPSWIGDFHKLNVVRMNNFQRTGKVPDGLWQMVSEFIELSLARNHLTGEIPSGYMEDVAGVENFDISDNQFSGSCPIKDSLPKHCNAKNNPWKCPISSNCDNPCQGDCSWLN